MNKDQVKGKAKEVSGSIKQGVGKATGNKSQELKGTVEKGAGKVQGAYGDTKEVDKETSRRH